MSGGGILEKSLGMESQRVRVLFLLRGMNLKLETSHYKSVILFLVITFHGTYQVLHQFEELAYVSLLDFLSNICLCKEEAVSRIRS